MSIYKPFDREDIVPSSQTVVTTGLWSGDRGALTASTDISLYDVQLNKGGEYYFDAFDGDPDVVEDAEVQFAITYGHIDGGGAPTLTNDPLSKLPTKVIYSQYRNLLLGQNDTKFAFKPSSTASFDPSVESDHIYVINIARSRIRERLDPGNWVLPLSGSNGLLTFIDDSNDTLEAFTDTTSAGRVYTIVSGAIDSVTGTDIYSRTFNGQGYGLVYPDLGIIVLNPNAIGPAVGFFTSGSSITANFGPDIGSVYSGSVPVYTSGNVVTMDAVAALPFAPVTSSATTWGAGVKSAYNHAAIYASLKLALGNTTNEGQFKARSSENISSTHYFVRLRSSEFNYSNNPTFRNPDDNTIIIPSFRQNPTVYLTTVGLLNDNNEVLAVAKISKPVRKSFTEELLMRVRLDY